MLELKKFKEVWFLYAQYPDYKKFFLHFKLIYVSFSFFRNLIANYKEAKFSIKLQEKITEHSSTQVTHQ